MISNEQIWSAVNKLIPIIKDSYWREMMIDFNDEDYLSETSFSIYVESLNLFYRAIFYNFHSDMKDDLIEFMLSTDLYNGDISFSSFDTLIDSIDSLYKKNIEIMKTFPCLTKSRDNTCMKVKISIRDDEQPCKEDSTFEMHKLINAIDKHKRIIKYLVAYIAKGIKYDVEDAYDLFDVSDIVKRNCKAIKYLFMLI